MFGLDLDPRGRLGPEDPDGEDPEPRPLVVEPAIDGLGGPDVEVGHRFQEFESIGPGDGLDDGQGRQIDPAVGGLGRDGGLIAEPLLGLVQMGRIEPEGRVLGTEAAGAFVDPPFAEQDRLPAVGQGLGRRRPTP